MSQQLQISFADEFPKYHQDNPNIWKAFEKYTFEAIALGHRTFSATFIFNRIRWKSRTAAEVTNDHWKVNNNFTAFYPRLFMETHPQYEGYFETRNSKFDELFKPITRNRNTFAP